MTKDKLIAGLTALTWLLVTGFLVHIVLYTYFVNFHDTPSVTWTNDPFPVLNPTVNAGDPISFNVQRCAKEQYVAKVNREIVDGIAYIVPEVTLIFEKGCVQENRLIPDVTKNLPRGMYHIRSHVEVTERWLWFSRVDTYETNTQDFTIKTPSLDGDGETVTR